MPGFRWRGVCYPIGVVFDIELLNLPRQSLAVRLDDTEGTLTVWRQPSDGGWYATLDWPAGTTVFAGRRLVTDGDLLRGLISGPRGALRVRPLGADLEEPGEEPWGATHALRYELP